MKERNGAVVATGHTATGIVPLKGTKTRIMTERGNGAIAMERHGIEATGRMHGEIVDTVIAIVTGTETEKTKIAGVKEVTKTILPKFGIKRNGLSGSDLRVKIILRPPQLCLRHHHAIALAPIVLMTGSLVIDLRGLL